MTSGAPDWFTTARFDVEAKASDDTESDLKTLSTQIPRSEFIQQPLASANARKPSTLAVRLASRLRRELC